MAFVRPTLPELVTRIQQDYQSRLELTGAVLRRSMVRVMARVQAGAVHMLHGHIEYLGRQLFPDRSEDEFLVRQASLYGYAPEPAKYASGAVEVEGDDGSVIPVGTRLLRTDGVVYESNSEVMVTGGTASLDVVAVEAGGAGNADVGVVLAFESPISGVSATATVGVLGLVGGADAERVEGLRARLLARLRNVPQGGAEGDYAVWALEVPGVTRAWVYPREQGAGTVVVRFLRDGDPDPIPDSAAVDAVQTHVDERRPVTAAAVVIAPIAKMWNPELSVTPDTSTTRSAVVAQIKDLFLRAGAPGKTLPVSSIWTAIGTAEGVVSYFPHFPDEDLAHGTGEYPVLGTVTFV